MKCVYQTDIYRRQLSAARIMMTMMIMVKQCLLIYTQQQKHRTATIVLFVLAIIMNCVIQFNHISNDLILSLPPSCSLSLTSIQLKIKFTNSTEIDLKFKQHKTQNSNPLTTNSRSCLVVAFGKP